MSRYFHLYTWKFSWIPTIHELDTGNFNEKRITVQRKAFYVSHLHLIIKSAGEYSWKEIHFFHGSSNCCCF